ISPALLADYFPRERRGRVFAVFFAAIPIGSALGYIVGGLVDHYFGWRQAFFVAGVPGLVLAALALRLYDPPRGAQDAVGAAIPVVTGFIGPYAGGWIGDYFLRVSRQAYLWVSGVVTLVAAPLTLVALAAPQAAVYWAAMVAAELCLFASTGPINSAIVNVV